MIVTLTKKFLAYEAGHEFDVIREDTNCYIATSRETGKRAVVPKSRSTTGAPTPIEEIPEEEPTVVWMTPEQEPIVEALREAVSLGEEPSIINLVREYRASTKFGLKEAKEDIEILYEYAKDLEVEFYPESKKPVAEPPKVKVSSTMSSTEASILEDLLEGKDVSKVNRETVGVSGDTPVVEPEPEPEPVKLEENQLFFTDITKGRLPKSGINHVIDIYPEDHWAEEHRIHIPEVSETHYWDTEILEAIVIAYKLNEKMLITGFPGTGKSTSVKEFAAWIRQPYMRLGGRGDLESASFIGMGWMEDGETVFKYGLLAQGVKNNYLVTIDEVWKIPSYIQMAMQHLYEKGGYLTLEDHPGTQEEKMCKPGKEFRLFLTDNVKGTGDAFDKFAATQIQDTSTLDRININVTLDYLEPKHEEKMLKSIYTKVDNNDLRKLVKFAGLARKSYKQGEAALTLSPRGLLAILQMHEEIGLGWAKSIELAFLNKLADEAELEAIKKMISTVKLEG